MMMHILSVTTLCLFLANVRYCDGAKILVFMPLSTRSETMYFYPLSRELAERGHDVTVLSSMHPTSDMGRAKVVVPPEVLQVSVENVGSDLVEARILRGSTEYSMMKLCGQMVVPVCEAALVKSNVVRDMVRSGQRVDLIIINGSPNDCGLALAHILKAPFVYVESAGLYPWHTWNSGNALPTAYTPSVMSPFSQEMTFRQRAENTLRFALWHYTRQKYVLEPLEKMLKTSGYLKDDSPSLVEIEKNVSLILVHRDPSLEFPTPVLSNVVKTGCVHCRLPKTLPQELEDFISGAGDHGFIYFSLGSLSTLQQNLQFFKTNFLDVFSALPQRVLVKWDTNATNEDIGVSENIKLLQWLPQQDVLGHPKCKLFVTHGGLFSTTETVYHGVPTVVFPMFWDQDYNAALMEYLGIGIKLEISQASPESLREAIKEVTTNPSYREKVKNRSRVLRDQPQHPLALNVFWIEFVLRHGGLPYLKSVSQDMPWYQTSLFDIYLFLLSSVIAIIFLVMFSIRALKKLCTKSQPKQKTN